MFFQRVMLSRGGQGIEFDGRDEPLADPRFNEFYFMLFAEK
jgi:hypothetical protein